tara:strand:+ start:241 stop:489 length:249 start_codon:yes stop_codon:yes gene_type:complete
MKRRKIDGFTFNYDKGNHCYEARGRQCWDDEHDEIPEPKLWDAALKLEKELKEEGHKAEADHSEKGWVEVNIIDDPKGYIIN